MPATPDTPDVEDGFLSQSSGQQASNRSIDTETLSPCYHQMWKTKEVDSPDLTTEIPFL